jgi:demethylmenaquinone methyltransferase/2-methoxy-6-polyprenyl-1,4-benzoquinol methylase/ArsR family transcriptional regulator
VEQWTQAAGLDSVSHRTLPPEPGSESKIAVSLWLSRDPRIAIAAKREVA